MLAGSERRGSRWKSTLDLMATPTRVPPNPRPRARLHVQRVLRNLFAGRFLSLTRVFEGPSKTRVLDDFLVQASVGACHQNEIAIFQH